VSPRVTVVIPTYNWATVLPFSIGSVLDQTFADFELFVIGDCCTDESEQVVKQIGDDRIEWINLEIPTKHQVGPNNEGLKRARGDIVAYLGHDDLWLPRHLELLVGALENTTFAHARQLRVVPNEQPRVLPPRGWSYKRGARIPPTSMAHRRTAATWRMPSETGQLDPEDDLAARLYDDFGKPTLVPLVTSVKFPAAERPNVYRTRPHDEQEEWLALIRATKNPEQRFRDRYAPWTLTALPGVWRVGKALTRKPITPDALQRYKENWKRKGLN
jgi:glycosyltransferase involved in cell wall biosynthesis